MKKNILFLISFATILLVWCFDSNVNVGEIDGEKWIIEKGTSVEESFDSQINQAQYLVDLEKFLSYNILSITENKSYNSDFSLDVRFDEKSSVQWGLTFSQKKISKSHDLETADIDFNVDAERLEGNKEPFSLSGSVSLLYKDKEMYANLHKLNVFMWEGNMVAKMYTLLWDLLIDKWVDLEVNSWWIVSIDEKEDIKLPYIMWTIKTVLKAENIELSPNFLWSVAELIDTINSYIDLWVSTDELNLLNYEVSYYQLSDKSIQKVFTWTFQWKQSAFDLSFVVSRKWLDFHLYNIKEYDEDMQDYKDSELELIFSIQEIKDSKYSVELKELKYQQKIVDLLWKIEYHDVVRFSAEFVLEPLEIIAWQKISWELNWNIMKIFGEWDGEFHELTWDIILFSDVLSSL